MNIEVTQTNKFEDPEWNASALFNDFNVRVIFKDEDNILAEYQNIANIEKYLQRDAGPVGVEWLSLRNPLTGLHEIYLKNSGVLVVWRLQDKLFILEPIAAILEHNENTNKADEEGG